MDELFDLPTEPSAAKPAGMRRPRLLRPDRRQMLLRPTDLDATLPADHEARLVWRFVEGLDLAPFHALVRSVEGGVGRPAIDPAILLALWLYATLEAVGSARALERLCDEHDAYRWICGGVSVNYHTLADFRVDHVERLDALLAHSVAALLTTGEVTLETIAHDGIKVRASAGTGSFRGRRGLERALEAAEVQVAALRAELDDDPAASARRVAAARERAAREREERVRRALEALPGVEAAKARRGRRSGKRTEGQTSTTDPDARMMRMADGGFRPAWNGQLTCELDRGLVCSVGVTNAGTDHGELGRAVERIREAHGRRPGRALADGGFAALHDIEALEGMGVAVYAPIQRTENGEPAPATRRWDGPGAATWRARMMTDEAQELYKRRAASIEWVNALARNRGLQRLPVRGAQKVRAVLLWFALAHNFARIARPQPAAVG